MANRVVCGNRTSGPGFYVSKPGQNALTATGANLLLSTDSVSMQFLESGAINLSNGSQSVSWGPFGFRPVILLVGQNDASFVYTNDNSGVITVQSLQPEVDHYWGATNAPTLSSRIEWLALRPGL